MLQTILEAEHASFRRHHNLSLHPRPKTLGFRVEGLGLHLRAYSSSQGFNLWEFSVPQTENIFTGRGLSFMQFWRPKSPNPTAPSTLRGKPSKNLVQDPSPIHPRTPRRPRKPPKTSQPQTPEPKPLNRKLKLPPQPASSCFRFRSARALARDTC